jgi:hypothetical protein
VLCVTVLSSRPGPRSASAALIRPAALASACSMRAVASARARSAAARAAGCPGSSCHPPAAWDRLRGFAMSMEPPGRQ